MNNYNKCNILMVVAVLASCSPKVDLLVKNGTVYDGTGLSPYKADVAIKNDKVVAVGELDYRSKKDIDASGLIVAPGFINMLSWAPNSLLRDGRSMSDLKQGVTLEVFGEGVSMGPVPEDRITEDSKWTTLGGYFDYAEESGISTNIASFVGATTIRVHVLGYDNVAPNDEQLDKMKSLVREAMEEGALGVGSSLIYPPAFFAKTDELIELNKIASEYGGTYISHMRSEGNKLEEAVDELIEIAKRADIDAEIYHLKAAGMDNWDKLDRVIEKIDSARQLGMNITADMYLYTAGSTGLTACLPPWVEEGGHEVFMERIRNDSIKQKILGEIMTPTDEWENFYDLSGDPSNIMLLGFKQDSLQKYTGMTLREIADQRNAGYPETILQLIDDNDGSIGTVYFLMSERNIKKQIQLEYMSFGSDAGSYSFEREGNPASHPRAYGNFARLLGKYVRDEYVIPLEEAIYKLTLLTAQKLKIKYRGRIAPGYYADLAIFDYDEIIDRATFENPHRYAEGMKFVIVNGVPVIEMGDHTGEMPGRAVRLNKE